MKPSLQLNMKQTQSLSPKLQQAIRLLQLSASELDAEIKAALDTNPLLELDVDTDNVSSGTGKSEFNEEFGSSNDPNLHDYLYWQLNLTPLSDRDHIIALNLIDSIDETGYLGATVDEILLGIKNNHPLAFAELDKSEVLAVLHRIQQFDPPGIGAQNLAECMLLQLEYVDIAHELRALCKVIINEHLALLARKELAQIKKLMQIDNATLNAIIAQIKLLHPKPGLIISPSTAEFIIPDVVAEKINQRWQVSLNPNLTQHLRINANYAQIMRSATNAQTSSALRKQYLEAQWLLDSIKNRNLTLLNVTAYIVQFQNDFMEYGETRMRPLILQAVAQDLGLSESTISRITTRKYLHTPRGTYELKFFFSNKIQGDLGECSSTAVKAIIKELINAENPAQPLSDQAIRDLIMQQGINIARRTVTKYREALGISASNLRGA